jgi:altronate dehydratase
MSLDEGGNQVLQAVVDTANGLVTKTEKWGEGQFIIPRSLPVF